MGGNNDNVEREEDLQTWVVITIGVICAVIVLALTIVLFILCWKRRQSIKKYKQQEQNAKVASPAVLASGSTPAATSQANGDVKQLKSAMKPTPTNTSYDNPAVDAQPPAYDDNKQIFTTQMSNGGGHDSYDSSYYQKQPHSNGGLVSNGNPNYSYENQHNLQRERSFKERGDGTDGQNFPMNPTSRNNSNVERGYLHLEDPYSRGGGGSHNNSGEGSMGSDQHKPKKVMYEVVV